MTPEPIVTATAYRVSCLALDHPQYQYFYVGVQFGKRQHESGYYVSDCETYYDINGVAYDEPQLMPQADALELAKRLAPTLTFRGCSVADVLARGGGQ